MLNLTLALNSITSSPGYWAEPSLSGKLVCVANPEQGPAGGAVGCSWEPQLALAHVALEGVFALGIGVHVSVLLSSQIMAGKLDGTGFKLVAQNLGCQETILC